MKKSLAITLVVLLLGATMAIPRAWADVDNTATIDLAEAGDGQVSVTVTTDVPGITTMSLALDVSVSSDMGNYVSAVYQPSQKVIDSTPSADNRYYTTKVEGDIIRMNIYVVNATDLFENNQLDLGTIAVALSEDAPSDSAMATFSVPQGADALRMVSGYDDEIRISDANLFAPNEPSITLGVEKATPEKNDKTAGSNATDVVGDTEETRVGADTVPIAGDTLMPIVIGLIVIIVAAIVVLIVFLTRRKSSSANDAGQDGSSDNANNGGIAL